jgi:hypothetical protein
MKLASRAVRRRHRIPAISPLAMPAARCADRPCVYEDAAHGWLAGDWNRGARGSPAIESRSRAPLVPLRIFHNALPGSTRPPAGKPAAVSCPANRGNPLLRVCGVVGRGEGGAVRRAGWNQSRVARQPGSRPGSERRSPPMDGPRARARHPETHQASGPSSLWTSSSSGGRYVSAYPRTGLKRQSTTNRVVERGELVTLTSDALEPDESCESRDCDDIAMLAIPGNDDSRWQPAPIRRGRSGRSTHSSSTGRSRAGSALGRSPPREASRFCPSSGWATG